MIDVLVVDDHPLLRAGAAALIGRSGDCRVVGEAASGPEALEKARLLRPQVVLLDILLRGDQRGVDVARSLRAELPETKILVLTNYAQEPYVRSMLEIGVSGYLLKDTPPQQILDAIRMVVSGRTVFSSVVADRMIGGYLGPSAQRTRVPVGLLMPREIEVLQLLAGGASNNEIARSLDVSVKAAQQHLSSIFLKLDARSRTEAVVKAVRIGLIVIEPASAEQAQSP